MLVACLRYTPTSGSLRHDLVVQSQMVSAHLIDLVVQFPITSAHLIDLVVQFPMASAHLIDLDTPKVYMPTFEDDPLGAKPRLFLEWPWKFMNYNQFQHDVILIMCTNAAQPIRAVASMSATSQCV